MPTLYRGRCLCGAVQLEISSEPTAVLSCFCDHCSKGAGGPNQVIAKFAADRVSIPNREDIAFYTLNDTGSGNPKDKAFCRICGCPLWTVPGLLKGQFYIIRAALIDGGLKFKPMSEIYVKNRPAWMSPCKDAAQFEESRK